MKRILAGFLIASGAAASALATPAFANDWEGVSLGIGGGYGMAKNDFHVGTGPAISGIDAGLGIDGFGGTGGLFSLSAGYDHAFFGPFIIGAFVDYDFSDIDTKIGFGSPIANLDGSINFKIENQLSVGGRVGYLVAPTTLFFSTFGYAHAESSNLNARLSLGGASAGGTLAGVGSFDGYFVGGGVETMISNGFSIKAEYRYTSLQAEKLDILPGSGLDDVITGSIKPQLQTARLSLNYHFGNGKAETPDSAIPRVTSSWTSPYLGLGGGYAVANNTLGLSDRLEPDPGSVFHAGIPLGHDGGFLAGTIGYDYQISPMFVVGAFGDADYTRLKQSNSLSLSLSGDEIHAGTSTEFKDMFMIGGRLGYLVRPETMLFVSGGYANVRADDTNLSLGASSGGFDLGGGSAVLIGGKRFDGGFIGGGIETRLTDSLSLKAEYRYVDLNSETVTLLPNELPEINQLVSAKFDPDIQMGRLSINYRFGGNTTPTAEAAPLK